MMFARVAYILVLLICYPQAVFNVIFSQKRGCLLECSVSPNYTPPRSLAQWRPRVMEFTVYMFSEII